MNKLEKLKTLVVRHQRKPDDFELLLRSIEFLRVELGMSNTALPTTLDEAVLEYKILSARKIAPPSEKQLERLGHLLQKVNGKLWGELRSRRQAEVLISALIEIELWGNFIGRNPDELVVFLGSAGVSLGEKEPESKPASQRKRLPPRFGRIRRHGQDVSPMKRECVDTNDIEEFTQQRDADSKRRGLLAYWLERRRMKNKLEKFVILDQPKPDDFEQLLWAIRFHRTELGIPTDELPITKAEAQWEIEELKTRVEPPTPEQLRKLDYLIKHVGGELTGELHSSAQVDLLIREIEKEIVRWERKEAMRMFVDGVFRFLTEWSEIKIAFVVVPIIFAIGWISYTLFPGFTILAGFALVFIAMTVIYIDTMRNIWR